MAKLRRLRNLTTSLSPREQEVLALIASGKTSREIAKHLGVSFKTAVAHRYHIYKKLDIHNLVQLTRAAIRMNLIKA